MTVILLSFLNINAQDTTFKAKYGITASIQGPDAIIGVSIPINSTLSLIPVFGLDYNIKTSNHSELYGVGLQINMGSNKLVPYAIVKYAYSTVDFSMYGVGYGGEYYFLPRVSANIELQLNLVNNTIKTGTGLGVTYYFGK